MAIEFFTQSGRGFRPRASIRKQGQIGLNQGAVRRFSVNQWAYAILGYDKETQLIAIKFTNSQDDPGVQRIIIKDGAASIAARSFFEYFEIDYRVNTNQYDVILDKDEKMLTIDISKGGEKES